jgi:hypothetical protein
LHLPLGVGELAGDVVKQQEQGEVRGGGGDLQAAGDHLNDTWRDARIGER